MADSPSVREFLEELRDMRQHILDSRDQARDDLSAHQQSDNEQFADIRQILNRFLGGFAVAKWLMGATLALAASDAGMHIWEALHR